MVDITSGLSQKDRISFYANQKCVTAVRQKEGNITIEYEEGNDSSIKALIILLAFIVFFSLLKVFLIIPDIENNKVSIVWYFLPVFFYVFLLVISITKLRLSDGSECLRNHGAEHKVFNAYQKLKRIPTIEEAKKYSRICSICGVTIYSSFITAQIIGFIVYYFGGFRIWETVLVILPLFLQGIPPFNSLGELLQFLTTSKPKEENLELAIEALSALVKKEEEKLAAKEINEFVDKLLFEALKNKKDDI